jgi:hypothetical protein
MKPVVMDITICPPRALARSEGHPSELSQTSLEELCCVATIPLQVTGGVYDQLILVRSDDHFLRPGIYLIGVGKNRVDWKPTPEDALRVLEILAYGFLDYGARECVCGRGYFVAKRGRGRPPKGGRAMTAVERNRQYRERLRKAE